MTAPLRVLCLDIEGGYGGSSRSLYQTLRALDRDKVTVEVWCKREGPIQTLYQAAGIPVRVEPRMPKASALPRLSRNIYQGLMYAGDFLRSADFRQRLAEAARNRFDVVHFNHEALAGLAWWLRRTVGIPAVMHLRTNVIPGPFARLQMALIGQATDSRIFITANEEATYRSLGGIGHGRIVFNPASAPVAVEPETRIPADGRLKVASLANFAWVRGVDRLIEVAEILRQRGRTDTLFVVAGHMALHGELPGQFAALVREKKTLADFAVLRGVADQFLFLGHVSNPEAVLAGCHVLAKLTRENNPWGRDVLEALASGCPVISVGHDSTFVETGVTGLLQPVFDAAGVAEQLIRYADDRDDLRARGVDAAGRIAKLCDPAVAAGQILSEWQAVTAARSSRIKGN